MRIIRLPSVQNVAASVTAVLPAMPLGETYDAIVLDLGGTSFTAAHLSNIRLRLDGKVIWDITGPHLNLINPYYKYQAIAAEGFAYLWFADPIARTIVGQNIGALDTSRGRYSNFALEVDIGAATAPTMTAYGVMGVPQKGPFEGLFRCMLKAVHAPAAAAKHNLRVPLGSNLGGLIRAIHLIDAGATITQLEVRKDGIDLLQDSLITLQDSLYLNAQNRTPQATHVAFDPLLYEDNSDLVNTLRPDRQPAFIEVNPTTSGADTITSYSDMYMNLAQV